MGGQAALGIDVDSPVRRRESHTAGEKAPLQASGFAPRESGSLRMRAGPGQHDKEKRHETARNNPVDRGGDRGRNVKAQFPVGEMPLEDWLVLLRRVKGQGIDHVAFVTVSGDVQKESIEIDSILTGFAAAEAERRARRDGTNN